MWNWIKKNKLLIAKNIFMIFFCVLYAKALIDYFLYDKMLDNLDLLHILLVLAILLIDHFEDYISGFRVNIYIKNKADDYEEIEAENEEE